MRNIISIPIASVLGAGKPINTIQSVIRVELCSMFKLNLRHVNCDITKACDVLQFWIQFLNSVSVVMHLLVCECRKQGQGQLPSTAHFDFKNPNFLFWDSQDYKHAYVFGMHCLRHKICLCAKSCTVSVLLHLPYRLQWLCLRGRDIKKHNLIELAISRAFPQYFFPSSLKFWT